MSTELKELVEKLENQSIIEAILFSSGDALSIEKIAEVTTLKTEEVEKTLTQIQQSLEKSDSSFELKKINSKYQYRTKSQYAPFILALKTKKPKKLSKPALETLSIVAYRQPIVKSDIEKIRGVDVSPTLKTLLERKIIKIIGHSANVGQPALYGTSDEFLNIFGLDSLEELPNLRDIRSFEKEVGEVGEDYSLTEIDSNDSPKDSSSQSLSA